MEDELVLGSLIVSTSKGKTKKRVRHREDDCLELRNHTCLGCNVGGSASRADSFAEDICCYPWP